MRHRGTEQWNQEETNKSNYGKKENRGHQNGKMEEKAEYLAGNTGLRRIRDFNFTH